VVYDSIVNDALLQQGTVCGVLLSWVSYADACVKTRGRISESISFRLHVIVAAAYLDTELVKQQQQEQQLSNNGCSYGLGKDRLNYYNHYRH